jgi:dolichol-phosphate mannosyltransferase
MPMKPTSTRGLGAAADQPGQDDIVLSVVIPCFNEQDVLPHLVPRLHAVLDALEEDYEVILVDDGSTDGTVALLEQEQRQWPQLVVRVLASNVGHQNAITAGLDMTTGDFVVTMDADLQDPPELIPAMLTAAREQNVDVVYAQREDRTVDSAFKRLTAGAYYQLMRRLTRVDLADDVGDFRLMSRRVVVALRALPENDRVYRLLIPWFGFAATTLPHTRAPRAAGKTKYSLGKMARLATSSATSFSTTPLRVATATGLVTAAVSLLASLLTVITAATGNTVPGWASLTCVVLFLGSVQLLCLGVLGEYVGRIYQQVQGRPPYYVDRDLVHERQRNP